jgi:hypothetical protein
LKSGFSGNCEQNNHSECTGKAFHYDNIAYVAIIGNCKCNCHETKLDAELRKIKSKLESE